jgi:hypothetical protein
MVNQICGDQAQHVIEGTSPIILLSGTESSAAKIGMRENAGKIEFGIVTVAGTFPDYTLTWVNTIHTIRAVSNIVLPIWIPACAAANSTWDRNIFAVPSVGTYTIDKISISPDGAIGQATSYMTLTVFNRGVGDAGTTQIVTFAYDNNTTHGVAKSVLTSMGTLANVALTAGQTISVAKSVTSAGQAWPGGLVVIEMTRAA